MARMRNPRRDELDEVLALLNRVFNYEQIGYDPIKVRKFFDMLETNDVLVMEEDGKIVSHVFMKPYRMSICGAILQGAEIGAVATEERYRGRGFASTLLKEALRQMGERGYDISTLGGYRDRYSRFGWEQGGAACIYKINRRSVRCASDFSDVELSKYDPSDEVLRRRIIESYERNQVHMLRQEVEQSLIYDAPALMGMEIWIARSSEAFAYLITRRSQNGSSIQVLEYGGDPKTLALGIRRAFREWDIEEAKVPSPNWYNEFTPFLERMSEEWSINPARQINILNLWNCLEKLLPIAKRGAEEVLERLSSPYSLTLRISETGQRATILFDRGCELTEEKGEEELILDRCGMVRLLFGQGRPSGTLKMGRRMASHLDLILPLPFYEWETDMR